MALVARGKGKWMVVSGNPVDGWHDVQWEAGTARVRFGKGNRVTDVWIADPTPEKLRRVPLSRITLTVGADVDLPDRRYRLARPKVRRLHPTFYANVATAYRDAVGRGMEPRKTIVDDTGAADATVARWIMEARKRGHLPPAKPGKVSA